MTFNRLVTAMLELLWRLGFRPFWLDSAIKDWAWRDFDAAKRAYLRNIPGGYARLHASCRFNRIHDDNGKRVRP